MPKKKKTKDLINWGEVRILSKDDEVYVNIDDLNIAIQYEIACMYDDHKDLEDFSEENAKIIQGTTDLICLSIDNLRNKAPNNKQFEE